MGCFSGWKRSGGPSEKVTAPKWKLRGGMLATSAHAHRTLRMRLSKRHPRLGCALCTYDRMSAGGMTMTVVPVSTRSRRMAPRPTPTEARTYHRPSSLLGSHASVSKATSGLSRAAAPIRSSTREPVRCEGTNAKMGETPKSWSLVKNGAPTTLKLVFARPKMPSQTCSGGANCSFSTKSSCWCGISTPAKRKVSRTTTPSTRPLPKIMFLTIGTVSELTCWVANCWWGLVPLSSQSQSWMLSPLRPWPPATSMHFSGCIAQRTGPAPRAGILKSWLRKRPPSMQSQSCILLPLEALPWATSRHFSGWAAQWMEPAVEPGAGNRKSWLGLLLLASHAQSWMALPFAALPSGTSRHMPGRAAHRKTPTDSLVLRTSSVDVFFAWKKRFPGTARRWHQAHLSEGSQRSGEPLSRMTVMNCAGVPT
mmetsp:Transcript_90500/g.292962  ORF Transcript_90500/g.292962 Transcript_90500/m.292962 type:complete len:423 (+) Transcript_90500:561-1829(+)